MVGKARTPAYVWLVILALACVEPAIHAWILYFPPVGTAPTGLHTGDSAIFIHCMRMFETDFFSPYATCKAAEGAHSFRYFPIPFFWLYAVLGTLGRLAHLHEFIALGLANGVGLALLLWAVYRFMLQAAPKYANRAFMLFTLGGGLGGVLYLIAMGSGLAARPDFEPLFYRYAAYDLCEGPNLSPVLLAPRLYNTIPLALCFAALTLSLSETGAGERRRLPVAACAMFAGTLINIRLGPMALGIAALYLFCRVETPVRHRVRAWLWLFVPAAAALAVFWAMLRMSPVYTDNTMIAVRQSLWVSPFLCAAFWHLFMAPRQIRRDANALPRPARVLAWGAIGYLAVFLLIYLGYHMYYGVLWRCADFSAAIVASDPALLGFAAGCTAALVRRRRDGESPPWDPEAWLSLWLLLYLSVAISAFGQGWFIRLVPHRLILFLGVPLSILSAKALAEWRTRRPLGARAWTAAVIACGVCSIVVASLYFLGPLGFNPDSPAFSWAHTEVMSEHDRTCLDACGEGMVLSPAALPTFADIVTVQGNSALGGFGMIDLSDASSFLMTNAMDEFYAPAVSNAWREEFLREWCVDWVYCPHAPPVADETVAQLRRVPWLREAAASGRAVLFQVVK